MRSFAIHDLMSSPVITILPHTRLPVIKQMMRAKGVHRLPVVDRGRLVGIVTLGDVRNAYPSDAPLLVHEHSPRALDQVRAAEIMRTEVMTIQAGAPVTRAVDLMLQHKISGLPVMDAQRLVGMITKSDICRALLAWEPVIMHHVDAVRLVAAR